MHRREFLKVSVGGVALLSLWDVGCGGDHGSRSAETATVRAAGRAYLSFDAAGNAYEILRAQHAVRRLDADGAVVWEIRGLGDGPRQFNYPETLAVDGDGFVYVADRGNSRVQVFDADGTFVRQIGGRDRDGSGDRDRSGLDFARQVAIGPDGLLYVCDSNDHQIEVFDRDGARLGAFGDFGTGPIQLNVPVSLAVAADGSIHVVDRGNFRVQVFGPRGRVLGSYGRRGSGPGEFLLPRSIVLDQQGNAFVADAASRRIVVFAPNGAARDAIDVRFADGRRGCPLYVTAAPQDQIYVTAVPLPA